MLPKSKEGEDKTLPGPPSVVGNQYQEEKQHVKGESLSAVGLEGKKIERREAGGLHYIKDQMEED